MSGTPFSNVNNIYFMIPEDQKYITTQWCSTSGPGVVYLVSGSHSPCKTGLVRHVKISLALHFYELAGVLIVNSTNSVIKVKHLIIHVRFPVQGLGSRMAYLCIGLNMAWSYGHSAPVWNLNANYQLLTVLLLNGIIYKKKLNRTL